MQPPSNQTIQPTHVYEVEPRKDNPGVDLISDALPFGRLWYGEPDAIDYAKFYSRLHDAVVRVYDEAGNVIERHEHKSDFKRVVIRFVFRLAVATENCTPRRSALSASLD
jgi:hypothetical protein